jgi:predicted acetyltransferase
MSRLRLELPRKEHQKEALEYKREHFSVGECELHGSSLLDKMDSYDAWLEHLQKSRDERTAAPAWVAASTFFVVRVSDDRIVGMIDIRHRLNDFLRSYGGHIGYGVRPSERKIFFPSSLRTISRQNSFIWPGLLMLCRKASTNRRFISGQNTTNVI